MAEFYDEGIPSASTSPLSSGTWLYGTDRGSIDRFHNRYGTPRLPRNEQWERYNRKILKQPPVKLKARQRQIIENAIREICRTRKWKFWVTNVRTNHVHTVVSALCKPERIRAALKASATKKLREGGCWRSERSPWVRKGSIKWLWTERALINAIVYVESDQGEPLL